MANWCRGAAASWIVATVAAAQDLRLSLDRPDATWRGAILVADGAAGGAARFDGDRAVIDAGACPVDGSAPLSLSAWIRTTHGGFCTPLMARDGDAVGLSLVLGRAPGCIAFEVWSWQRSKLVSRTRVDDGRWHRVEAAYDPATHRALLLVDGRLEAHGDVGAGGSPAARLRLGDNIGAHQPFAGDLDEVVVSRERTHADLFAALQPVLTDAERRTALAAVREAAVPAATPALAADALRDWPARRLAVRAHVLDALGLAPPPAAVPFDARVHGAIEQGDVTVERVSLQGFPGRRATGWLWRPTRRADARQPAVLCPHGHWQHGALHPVVQARCAAFARFGWVALTMDSDHTEAVAAGFSPLTAMCWHNLRALSWLRSRDDVDPARVASTGCSGGAQQTYYLMALTDDLAAAAPICMACYVREILADDGAHCGCNHLPRLAHGTDVPELCAVFAPKPAFFGSVTGDWTARFPQQGLPELQRLWRQLGVPGALRSLHRDEGHDYSRPMREAVYGFLQAAFAGDAAPANAPPVAERAFEPIAVDALRALGGPGRGELLDEAFAARELLARRPPVTDVRALAPALPWRVAPRAIAWRDAGADGATGGWRRGVVRGDDGVPVPFALRAVGAPDAPWTVVVDGRGAAIARIEQAQHAAQAGRAAGAGDDAANVAFVDPRFAGEWAPFAAAWRRNGLLLGRGELYDGAHDVALLCASLPGRGAVTLRARDGAGPVAVVAATLCERVRRVEVDTLGPSYADAPNRTPLAPELLRAGGLDAFVRALRERCELVVGDAAPR